MMETNLIMMDVVPLAKNRLALLALIINLGIYLFVA